MTRFSITFMVSILLLCITTPTFAAALYLSEVGTPVSVGTAGVANVTNTIGADSAVTNPAGMIGLEEDKVLAGVQVLLPTVRFDSDIATAGGSDGGNAADPIVIPSLFAVKSLNEDWRIGFGVTAPLGGGVNYGHDFVGRYQAQKSELSVVGISPSVAYRINDRLSLGAGVAFSYTSMNLHIAINQPGPLSPDGQIKMDELDDWGYQGYLGAIYKATDRLTFGAVYRSEADVELEGDIKFKNVTFPPLNTLTSQFDKARLDFSYPQLIQVGMKYQLNGDTILMADFNWEEWSAFGNTRLGLNGDASAIKAFDRDWNDTWHLGFALAHKLSEDQAITAGIGYDSSPVSDSKRTADLPADEQLRLSAAY
ncbi:MAG: outer membrane protein transport protein, partial [Desulfobacterales bacterium]